MSLTTFLFQSAEIENLYFHVKLLSIFVTVLYLWPWSHLRFPHSKFVYWKYVVLTTVKETAPKSTLNAAVS